MTAKAINKIIDIRTHLLWNGGIEHKLWSALNMLEAALCTLDNFGGLHWHNHNIKIFAQNNLPQNLDELGKEIGIDNFENLFLSTKIHGDTRKLILGDIGFSLIHNISSGLLTIQKLFLDNKNLENDIEAKNLANALNENRIILFKQPIVCAKTLKPKRYECLARLVKENGDIALPFEFIPAAERSGLIKDLDIHTLKLALEYMANNKEFKIATNVSFATICDQGAQNEIFDLLKHFKISPNSLTIEITETIAIHDFDIAANFAQNLKNLNTRLSLDDFGSGHTSFKSLRELAINEVKIDGQYVKNIETKKESLLFISAINAIAKEINIECVVERIENENELNLLLPLNIDAFQGYFFGKPSQI